MTTEDVYDRVKADPFHPVRLILSDGRRYDIRRREQCMVGVDSVMVGVSTDSHSPFYEQIVRLNCQGISRIEPLLSVGLDL